MARGSEEGGSERVTIVGRLVVQDDLSASKLLLLMRRFRDAVEMAHNPLFKKGLSETEVKRRLTKYLSNAWYANSAIKVAKLYREQESIKLKKPLLYSVGSTDEGGNRNFKLVSTDKVLVKIPRVVGGHEWVEFKSLFGKKQLSIIEELVKGCHTSTLSRPFNFNECMQRCALPRIRNEGQLSRPSHHFTQQGGPKSSSLQSIM